LHFKKINYQRGDILLRTWVAENGERTSWERPKTPVLKGFTSQMSGAL